MNLQNFEILIFLLGFLRKNTKEIGKEIVQKYHENISKFRSFVNSFWSIFMSNKIERSFALAILFRFSDRRMHLLFPIFPTYRYKSSLEIRHNFMRAVSQLMGCKFPLWHTSNRHEQKVHYLSSNLSIYDFSIQSKAIDVQPFEVWVRNEKNGLFSKLPKRKIYISLRKCDSKASKAKFRHQSKRLILVFLWQSLKTVKNFNTIYSSLAVLITKSCLKIYNQLKNLLCKLHPGCL